MSANFTGDAFEGNESFGFDKEASEYWMFKVSW